MQTIKIRDMGFMPTPKTVYPPETVEWINEDSVPHQVVFDGTRVSLRLLHPSESCQRTFDDNGHFHYHCGLHPHMKGEIEVKSGE
jgi:plastocyanin